MTGKQERGVTWCHISVTVRSDIFQKAHEMGIDISALCNRALADRTGIDYHQLHFADIPLPPPVIIAQEGGSPGMNSTGRKARASHQPPVINADDPAAIATMMSIKGTPGVKTTEKIPHPASSYPGADDTRICSQAGSSLPVANAKNPACERKRKEDSLKKFFHEKVSREDVDDAVISKEDMYLVFARWCHDHHIKQVPDKKSVTVALKNRFSIGERAIGGIPCWVHVRLK